MDRPTDASAFGAAALVATFLLTPAVASQEALPDTVNDTVEVRVVDLDVVVVDRRGVPVLDLERGDFEVMEDGEPVEIEYFSAPSGDAPPSAVTASGLPEAPAPSGAGATSSPRTVILFLDDFDLHPAHRARVFDDLREALTSLDGPGVRFLVARFRSQLEVTVSPTTELGEVLASLAGDEEKDARGLEAALAIRQTQRAIVGSYQSCESARFCVPCVDNWEQMVAFATDYARAEETRTAVAVAGLADLVSALAGLPGRKDVLYVGDGFQQQPGLAMLRYVADVCADERDTGLQEVVREAAAFDESNRFTALAAHAATNRVTLHMLDAGGVRASSGSSVESADHRFAPTTENDGIRISNLQNTHFILANETGGQAILNAARPREDLERLGRQLAANYSIGFTPRHPATGRVHLLEVRLVGSEAKGRRLRYRRSYRDKQLEARLADQLVAALFLGQADDPLGIRVRAGSSQRLERRRHELPIGILLPVSALGEVRGSRSIRVWMTAVSDDGLRTGVRQQLVDLGPGEVEADSGVYSLVVDMELREGDYTIAVGVRDELTGVSSFARLRASVPTPSVSEP